VLVTTRQTTNEVQYVFCTAAKGKFCNAQHPNEVLLQHKEADVPITATTSQDKNRKTKTKAEKANTEDANAELQQEAVLDAMGEIRAEGQGTLQVEGRVHGVF